MTYSTMLWIIFRVDLQWLTGWLLLICDIIAPEELTCQKAYQSNSWGHSGIEARHMHCHVEHVKHAYNDSGIMCFDVQWECKGTYN